MARGPYRINRCACGGRATLRSLRVQTDSFRRSFVMCRKCHKRTKIYRQRPFDSWEDTDVLAVMEWNRSKRKEY